MTERELPPPGAEALMSLTRPDAPAGPAQPDKPNGEEHGPRPFAPIEGEDREPPAARFKLEDWNDITFDPNEEWLIEDVLPKRGLGLIYGKQQSFKSFVAMNFALHVALGAPWAGKRVEKGSVVYIAAEGAKGMRKRITAYKAKHTVPRGQFALISAAPNLGAGDGDLPALVAAVKGPGVSPALIVIDTASMAIGSADENGAGMAAFVGNAQKLAWHFDCLVLVVHHVGHDDAAQKRPRGWSGLGAALDVQILCERPEDEKRTTLTVQKLKDEEDGVCFEARLSRAVVGRDKNGNESSSLIVNDVTATTQPAAQPETGRRSDQATIIRHEYLAAYDRLADAVPATLGFNAKSVRKVSANAIRDEVKDRGFLDTDEAGKITSTGRSQLRRAKNEWLGKTVIIERKRLIWRPN